LGKCYASTDRIWTLLTNSENRGGFCKVKLGKYDKEIGKIIKKIGENRNFHVVSMFTLHPPWRTIIILTGGSIKCSRDFLTEHTHHNLLRGDHRELLLCRTRVCATLWYALSIYSLHYIIELFQLRNDFTEADVSDTDGDEDGDTDSDEDGDDNGDDDQEDENKKTERTTNEEKRNTAKDIVANPAGAGAAAATPVAEVVTPSPTTPPVPSNLDKDSYVCLLRLPQVGLIVK